MSRKVQTFASIVTNPLNVYNYRITIPGIDVGMKENTIVRSTTFPSQKLREVTLHYQGESIVYPAIPENSGTWSFQIPESDSGIIRAQFERMRRSFYNQRTGRLVVGKWITVEIYPCDLADNQIFGVRLHGCWLQGRNDVSLDNSNPATNWNWDYSFRYQWIEDMDAISQGSENPFINLDKALDPVPDK